VTILLCKAYIKITTPKAAAAPETLGALIVSGPLTLQVVVGGANVVEQPLVLEVHAWVDEQLQLDKGDQWALQQIVGVAQEGGHKLGHRGEGRVGVMASSNQWAKQPEEQVHKADVDCPNSRFGKLDEAVHVCKIIE